MSSSKTPGQKVGNPNARPLVSGHDSWERVPIPRVISFAEHDERITSAGNYADAYLAERIRKYPALVKRYVLETYDKVNEMGIAKGVGVPCRIAQYESTESSSQLERLGLIIDENAKHEAMLQFVEDMRLTDSYYGGAIIRPYRVRKLLSDIGPDQLEPEYANSWAVSIGFLDSTMLSIKDPIFLTAEFRYGEGGDNYNYSLMAYKLANTTREELRNHGLV